MPRRCTVCDHGQRSEIDRALVRGAPYRHIAAQYAISTGALQRHKGEHIPKLLTDAAEADAAVTAADLLSDLRSLQHRTERILSRAEGTDDALALRAVAELRGLLAVGFKAVETTVLEDRLDTLERTLNPRRIA